MKTTKLIFTFEKCLAAIFLAAFLAIGSVLTFTMPPFEIPDEDVHWNTGLQRIEDATGRHFRFGAWRTLPDTFDVQRIKHKPQEKMRNGIFSDLPNRASAPTTYESHLGYGHIGSYPQIFIAWLVEACCGPSAPYDALHGFYLARLFGGLLILLPLLRLVRLSFSRPAAGVLPMLALSLCPVFIQQSFAVSSDVVCNAFTLWMLVVCFYVDEATTLDWSGATIFGILACTTKPVMILVGAVGILYWRMQTRHYYPMRAAKKFPGFLQAALLIVSTVIAVVFLIHKNIMTAWLIGHFPTALRSILDGVIDRWRHSANLLDMGWLDLSISLITFRSWLIICCVAATVDLASRVLFFSKPAAKTVARAAASAAVFILGALAYSLAVGLLMQLLFHKETAPFFNYLQPRYFFSAAFMTIAGIRAFLDIWRSPHPHPTMPNAATPLDLKYKFVLAGLNAIVVGLLFSYASSIYIDVAIRYW